MRGNTKHCLPTATIPAAMIWNGRGTLSEEALGAFTEFFLKVCIDQVVFMESLMQPDRLRGRILRGPKRKQGEVNCPPRQEPFLKQCSIVGNCRRARKLLKWR